MSLLPLQSHKIYTDGSKLDNEQTGAAYHNETYRHAKSSCIGKFYSIFTAEPVGIQQVTNHKNDH